MDLLGCGITTLNLTPSLTLMISTLKSFLISTLRIPLKKKKAWLGFSTSSNEKMKEP